MSRRTTAGPPPPGAANRSSRPQLRFHHPQACSRRSSEQVRPAAGQLDNPSEVDIHLFERMESRRAVRFWTLVPRPRAAPMRSSVDVQSALSTVASSTPVEGESRNLEDRIPLGRKKDHWHRLRVGGVPVEGLGISAVVNDYQHPFGSVVKDHHGIDKDGGNSRAEE